MDILAPLSGPVVPLESVPDPVFAGRLAGDGACVDPTSSEVLAPVAGRVTQLHPAHHAVVVTSDEGVEVLVHVGLDTVQLKGQGFTPLVRPGEAVARGQALLRFDPEVVAARARSLLTVVLVNPPEKLARVTPARGLVMAGRSTLLSLELAGQAAAPPPDRVALAATDGALWSQPVILPNLQGLHARPAAVVAALARRFAAEVRLVRDDDEANAKSVVAILGLATARGDALRVRATGVDAREAVHQVTQLLAAGAGEAADQAPTPPASVPPAPAPPPPAPQDAAPAAASDELRGVMASPGLAIGQVVQLRHGVLEVAEAGGPPDQERARLEAALQGTALQLEGLRRQGGDPARAAILGVHLALLEDPDLLDATRARIGQGKCAAFAWQEAYRAHADRLAALESPLLRERAADVRDVGGRVLACLAGGPAQHPALPAGAIVVAEEITPSEMAAFEGAQLAGLCTTTGSSTSHVAILARAMGVPAVCGIDGAALGVPDGTPAVIDGGRGTLRLRPDAATLQQARDQIARQAARRDQERAAAFGIAQTRDGHRVRVAANIANLAEARSAVAGGAEGVGLLRSEFLFVDRAAAPSEEEQAAAYLAIAEVLGRDRPLVVRTLDVGGDKPIAYLPLPREQNPFLGLRGIRVSLDRPDLLRSQLRAILRAAPASQLHIMFPMISGLEELRAARRLLAEVQPDGGPRVEVGVMIEVPSAVAMAEPLAREVDFFSIGTNDLTQYTLAMDRGHPILAPQADALHPAVLRMIRMAVEGAHRHGRWVGVCGGIASEPLAVPVLVGLGVDELSVSVPAIASVKAALGRWTLAECQALASEALQLGTRAEVRALLAATPPAPSQPGARRPPEPTLAAVEG